jgi:hypothetical protein
VIESMNAHVQKYKHTYLVGEYGASGDVRGANAHFHAHVFNVKSPIRACLIRE